ncbi:MAG TPA: 4-hydroxyproline epimerase, partial [Saprospiraceae bacterium]|nr:4-hydroxyproline epimerase [Saprospiraceae bacterium]
MMDKRNHFLREYDWIREALMYEPRGHDMMSGSILYPPSNPDNDVAVLFIETSGCLPMCGHGTIGTITIAIEEGYIIPKIEGKVRMEAPAGLILIDYTMEGKKVSSVKLTNVASFLYKENIKTYHPKLGDLTCDVSYGGNFYAIFDPQPNFPGLEHFSADELVSMARDLRTKLNQDYQFEHPLDPNINWCSHVMWTGKTIDPTSSARNAVFYGEKAIDRSPCGTGTSARMAQLAAKGKLAMGDEFIHESYIGSKFIGRIEATSMINEYAAIIPSIEGWAKIYGYNTILVDPDDDPYAGGFIVK